MLLFLLSIILFNTMKYLVYTLSIIFLFNLPANGQDASGEATAVELTKREKRQLKKETKKKEKELKKDQKKSSKKNAIKIGELPPDNQEDEINPIKIDVNLDLGLVLSEKSAEKVKIHRGMSFAYGIVELADISGGGISFSNFEWAQNRPGRILRSSSQSWDVFFNQYRLSKSPFWFRTGVSISWSVLDFGEFSFVSTDYSPQRVVAVQLDADSINIRTKSSLTTSYIEAPLELVFNSSNDGNRGVTIGIGGYVGLRLQTTRKINYADISGAVQDRRINSFYNNPVSYGVSARLGYGSIYVKGRFALSKYFQQGEDITSKPYQLAAITLGIDLL